MKKRTNWLLWAGFLTALAALLSYPFFFAQFPVTRDVPWANYLLFAVAAVLLIAGLRRGFAQGSVYGGKISGPILGALSLTILAGFSFEVLIASKHLPAAQGAPRVGQKAPDFSLSDSNGKPVSLANLLSSPIGGAAGGNQPVRGVLLIFYRGYW